MAKVMESFVEQQRDNLYGSDRNTKADGLRSELRQSHVFRDGEFNIDKQSLKPGFTWSTTTVDDYKKVLKPVQQGKQFDRKQELGSDIPMKQHDVPQDTYVLSTFREAYTLKDGGERVGYIGNDPATNWPDMTPKLIRDKKLGYSEYKDTFVTTGIEHTKPDFGKINTANIKLPVPLDQRKHKISVSLGKDDQRIESDYQSSFLEGTVEPADQGNIRKMKAEMEWNSKVFRSGDYNDAKQNTQSTFDLDYGKKAKGASHIAPPPKANQSGDSAELRKESERLLSAGIHERLHYMPQLIGDSMMTDTTKQQGADGKKYHTRAHFELGSDTDPSMSVYYKDYKAFGGSTKPSQVRMPDARVLQSDDGLTSKTSNKEDFPYATAMASTGALDRKEYRENMGKRDAKNINFAPEEGTVDDQIRLSSVFQRDFRGPPRNYRVESPAKERKCTFDFLESDGALPYFKNPVSKSTEVKDNYKGSEIASKVTLGNDKMDIMEQAKRRLKSGRRAHFILGTHKTNYKTVSNDTFTGRAREDDNMPAAGKVEKNPGKEWSHMKLSENTQDFYNDPHAPTLQESRPALDNYQNRRRQLPEDALTVMQTDFLPMPDRSFTVPQLKQMRSEEVKASKATQRSHFFHTDTSSRNNYESTAMASYIKPEEMSGKVHLSSLQ